MQLLTFNDTEQQEKYVSDLDIVTKKLQQRESEVIELQKKVIELYEELRRSKILT